MAQRILGMGDIVGLVTEAMEKFDQEETAKLQEKMEKGEFTLDDFMAQMSAGEEARADGQGHGHDPGHERADQADEHEARGTSRTQMGRMQAIYDSMNTQGAARTPTCSTAPRRRRIAAGAGVRRATKSAQFIKQFEMSRDMMRAVGGMGMMGKLKLMKASWRAATGGLGMPGGPMLKTKKSGCMEKKDRNKKKRSR